jgi:hypothetical protein
MPAWTVTVENATWGLVPTVDVLARRKCGREERFDVSRWPAGWRILRLSLSVPESVLRDARRLAVEVWPDECF